MEEVLKAAGKIYVDPAGGAAPNIVPYLPLPAPAAALTPKATP